MTPSGTCRVAPTGRFVVPASHDGSMQQCPLMSSRRAGPGSEGVIHARAEAGQEGRDSSWRPDDPDGVEPAVGKHVPDPRGWPRELGSWCSPRPSQVAGSPGAARPPGATALRRSLQERPRADRRHAGGPRLAATTGPKPIGSPHPRAARRSGRDLTPDHDQGARRARRPRPHLPGAWRSPLVALPAACGLRFYDVVLGRAGAGGQWGCRSSRLNRAVCEEYASHPQHRSHALLLT